MTVYLMRLGPWRFQVPGLVHDQLHRRFDYRWVPQMRVGRRPALQFTGPGVEKIDIRGVMYPNCRELSEGAYGDLFRMRQAAMTGIPYPMADAVGIYYGPWCILMIRDEQEYFNRDGTPRKVEFSIDLVAYGNAGG